MPHGSSHTQFIYHCHTAVGHESFLHLRINFRKPEDLRQVAMRPVHIKRAHKLSITYHYATRDIVKNVNVGDGQTEITRLLALPFTHAKLETTTQDVTLELQGKKLRLRTQSVVERAAPNLAHDRAKRRAIMPQGKPYLHALGLTDMHGEVRKSAQDKFRQINKFIEIADGLIAKLPSRERLRIVDMGAGKGYLTFALYDHLAYARSRPCELLGVERRGQLVSAATLIAQENGFTELRFVEGDIASTSIEGTDILIALHACDTATDDALAKAIRAECELILAAPCCHKQIRHALRHARVPPLLEPLTRHGIFEERLADMLTDTLRGLILEANGYRVQIFEFIDGEHTPKNIMLAAHRRSAPLPEAEKARKEKEIKLLKEQFGIRTHALEAAIGQVYS